MAYPDYYDYTSINVCALQVNMFYDTDDLRSSTRTSDSACPFSLNEMKSKHVKHDTSETKSGAASYNYVTPCAKASATPLRHRQRRRRHRRRRHRRHRRHLSGIGDTSLRSFKHPKVVMVGASVHIGWATRGHLTLGASWGHH